MPRISARVGTALHGAVCQEGWRLHEESDLSQLLHGSHWPVETEGYYPCFEGQRKQVSGDKSTIQTSVSLPRSAISSVLDLSWKDKKVITARYGQEIRHQRWPHVSVRTVAVMVGEKCVWGWKNFEDYKSDSKQLNPIRVNL
ncbi:hypothetical protein RRG08_066829 [Elysia crispata]|uniref:Uncharacterized protein n=1 Tax=Elysia crispata TaxID=231223 RepID=A0AAE0XQK1_9GAST|nr:hypothetical protein RRG08_066829 [Elysia crispata]